MSLSVTPLLIMEAARKRGWRITLISERRALYRLDVTPTEYYYIRNITSHKSSELNAIIARDKELFQKLVSGIGVEMPAMIRYTEEAAAHEFLKKHGRIVVKPADMAHGKGITLGIETAGQLTEAIEYGHTFSKKLLLQQQITGDDYRLLFIDGKMVAATIRKPAYVTGDGKQTVRQLMTQENTSGKRTEGYGDIPSFIDAAGAERYLGEQMDSVPAEDEEFQVVGVANIGRGGVAIDVTDEVEQGVVASAQRIIDHLHLGLCGVDFLITTTGKPYLIEINTGPSLGLHEYPFAGRPRHTPEAFLDWLVKK